MKAGRLDKCIDIQEFTRARGSGGGKGTATWTLKKTIWATIEPMAGKENVHGLGIDTTVSHKITTRYTTGINSKNRIKWNNRIFNINSVINANERDRMLVFLCTETF